MSGRGFLHIVAFFHLGPSRGLGFTAIVVAAVVGEGTAAAAGVVAAMLAVGGSAGADGADALVCGAMVVEAVCNSVCH